LLNPSGDDWKISGLFDFGDVMTGWGEYDLLGPSVFMAGGRPERVGALLEGYGYSGKKISALLTRRLMTLFLLHRYSDPLRQLRLDDWQEKAGTVCEL